MHKFYGPINIITVIKCNRITGMLISPQPDQEGNKLQRQKILIFIQPIYNRNWMNISTIYIYVTKLTTNEIFSTSNKIHQAVGRGKDLSVPRKGPKNFCVLGRTILKWVLHRGVEGDKIKHIGLAQYRACNTDYCVQGNERLDFIKSVDSITI